MIGLPLWSWGELVEEGETAQVFSHPKEKLTRDFMDTASNINKIYELLEEKHELTQIKDGEKLVLLTYSGGNAGNL